jgi:xylulokinase
VPCVLAVDLGTSGLKVAVVDDTGRVLAHREARLTTIHLAEGGAEQDADEWWRLFGECARAIAPAHADDIAAVAVTSQYMSIVAIDADGRPLHNAIMWMDSRGARGNHHRIAPETVDLFFERHGLAPLGFGDQTHIAFLRAARPDVHASAAAFVEPVDALNARLTGRICATQTTAMPLMTVDNRTHGATAHDPDLVAASGIDPAQLPPIVPFDEIVGTLTPAAAEHLGLHTDTVVVTGTIDSITSGIGCGAIDADACALIVGTTTVIVTHVDRKTADLDHGLVSVPSPLPGRWFVMAENGVGGKPLELWLDVIGQAHDRAEHEAATSPPGSNGVLHLPWLNGTIAPVSDGRMRGGFVNLGLDTSRADMTRAVYEGVALNAAWLLPHVAALAERPVWPRVRFGGGGARSAFWAQVLADVLGTTVERVAEPAATNARGAALLAHARLGHIAIADIPDLVQVTDIHEPDEAAHATHRRALDDFIDVHERMRPFYANLSRRSG